MYDGSVWNTEVSKYIIKYKHLLEEVQDAILAGPDPAPGSSSEAGPSG
jgi:hypothetical protein